jgi:serine kinase of HPr protein (carbohydrate metabolism regulator)
MLDKGFILVSDDRTIIRKEGAKLVASPPETIKGKLEVRGIGIVEIGHVTDVPVALIVELKSDIERLPDDSRERLILGVGIPLVSVDAMTASAPSKVALALDRLGLKF